MYGKEFDIAGKGTLTAVNTGGHIYILEGNVQDLNGNNLYVVISEESEIIVNKKNPEHADFVHEYIDMETYHHNEIGDQFYFGYESELQVIIAGYSNEYQCEMFSLKAFELFDLGVITALAKASDEFDKDIKKMRGWDD